MIQIVKHIETQPTEKRFFAKLILYAQLIELALIWVRADKNKAHLKFFLFFTIDVSNKIVLLTPNI